MPEPDVEIDPPEILADTPEGQMRRKRVALILVAAALLLLIIAIIWWIGLQPEAKSHLVAERVQWVEIGH